MTVFLDIGEFLENPLRSGIQRLVREVLRHWPPAIDMQPVAYDAGTDSLNVASEEAVRVAVAFAAREDFSLDEARREIARLREARPGRAVSPGPRDAVLVPELFFEPLRLSFYGRLIADHGTVGFVVPDFLPWLRPSDFPISSTRDLMPYLGILLRAPHRAFISADVASTYASRIARREPDPGDLVFDLGADGLGLARQSFDPGKRSLVSIGTLESRKGQDRIYEAFRSSAVAAGRLRMVFVGAVPPHPDDRLLPLLTNERPDVAVIANASDGALIAEIEKARACIFTSPAEGYGLPPMECLHAGLPVVVHETLPALAGKPGAGQIRLPRDDVASIAAAMDRLADDAFAAALWRDAAAFPSVTWRETVGALARWIASRG